MQKNKISINSIGFLLLRQMYNVSTMWKKDVMLYLNSLTQENSASNIYKKLFQCRFVEEYESFSPKDITSSHELKKTDIFKKLDNTTPKRGDYVIVNITKAGINFLIDNINKSKYISKQESDFIYKNYKSVHKRFRTTDPYKYLRELERSHVMNLISTTGAKVFPNEKPSLLDLYLKLKHLESTHDSKYLDLSISQINEIKSNSGFYYSLQEFREFDKLLCRLNNMPLGEEYRSSTASGIFISDKRCLIVYLSEPTSNKLVYLSDTESILKSKLLNYFSSLFDFRKYVVFIDNKNIRSSIDALVLSDSNSLIYSMATGKKHGRFHYQEGKDLTKLYTPKKILLHDNELFSNIYCVPATRTGLKSLKYLADHSIKEYDSDSYQQVRQHPDLFECTNIRGNHYSYGYAKQKDITYPNMNRSVIYMPVAEVNMLFRLSIRNDPNSDYYDRYAFITYPDLTSAIAHSIRKDKCIYYKVEDSILYVIKNTNHINEVTTKKQIYFLPSRNKHICLTQSEYKAIHKIVEYHKIYSQEEYWTQSELDNYMKEYYESNEIDVDKIINDSGKDSNNEAKLSLPIDVVSYNYYGYQDSEEVFEKLESLEKIHKKRHKKLTKDNRLSVSSYDVDKIKIIKKASRLKNKSISKYILDIVYKQALIDVKESKEDTAKSLEKMRRRYK